MCETLQARFDSAVIIITIHWAPGHGGVEGNEIADAAAGEAVRLKATRQRSHQGVALRHSSDRTVIRVALGERLRRKTSQSGERSSSGDGRVEPFRFPHASTGQEFQQPSER